MFASACGKQKRVLITSIPYYLPGLSRAHFLDGLSRNSCIKRFHSHDLLQIYCNKRKFLRKKKVQLSKDWFDTPAWLTFYSFVTINMADVTSYENAVFVERILMATDDRQ